MQEIQFNDSLIIIPTFNEVDNIGRLLREVMNVEFPLDVLVVDDASSDGTVQAVRALIVEFEDRITLIQRPEKLGLGTAYIAGFKWALSRHYSYIFEMDADFSHRPEELVKLYNACHVDEFDVAIGSRYKKGIRVVNLPFGRIILSLGASWYVRLITGMPVSDPTAGFICYRRRVLSYIKLDEIKFIGYAFQIEMKFRAYQIGFRMVEVPIVFFDRERGVSKLSKGIIKEAIFGVIKMKFNSLFGKFNEN